MHPNHINSYPKYNLPVHTHPKKTQNRFTNLTIKILKCTTDQKMTNLARHLPVVQSPKLFTLYPPQLKTEEQTYNLKRTKK